MHRGPEVGVDESWATFAPVTAVGERRVPGSGPVPGLRVGDVMSSDMVAVPSWATVASLGAYARPGRHGSYPVVDVSGAAVGVLHLAGLPQVAADRKLGELCVPACAVRVLRTEDSLDALLSESADLAGPMALVTAGDRLVGVLSRGGLLRLRRSHI